MHTITKVDVRETLFMNILTKDTFNLFMDMQALITWTNITPHMYSYTMKSVYSSHLWATISWLAFKAGGCIRQVTLYTNDGLLYWPIYTGDLILEWPD